MQELRCGCLRQQPGLLSLSQSTESLKKLIDRRRPVRLSHRSIRNRVRTQIRTVPMATRRLGLARRGRSRRRRVVLFGEDGGAAERAGGVEAEPGVDAARVEPVPAPRQQAALLAVRQLRDEIGRAHV